MLGSESVDLHAGAVLGNEAVPDDIRGKRLQETLIRGPRWECQNGISDGQKDGRNRGWFLYSDRRLTVGGEQ